MKPFTFISFFIFCCLFSSMSAQVGILEWENNFGGSRQDESTTIIQTNDGNYLIVGQTKSLNGDVSNNSSIYTAAWLIKTNTNGELLWEVSLSDPEAKLSIEDVVELEDGNLVVVGVRDDGDPGYEGDFDAWIAKLTSTGELLWEDHYGGTNKDIAKSIVEADDGGFIIAGYTWSNDGDIEENKGEEDVWVFKVNDIGELIWSKTYGGSEEDIATSAVQVSNGGYLIAGHTISSEDGDVEGDTKNFDFWILKLNNQGDLIWEENYGSFGANSIEKCNDLIELSDGNFLAVGSLYHYTSVYTRCLALKINPDGEEIWRHDYQLYTLYNSDVAHAALESKDGSYVLAGSSQITGSNIDFSITKISSDGELIWFDNYGSNGSDQAISIIQSVDGSYVMTGRIGDDGLDVEGEVLSYWDDIWLLKVTDTSINNTVLAYQEISDFANINFSIRPNPNKGKFIIESNANEIFDVKIYNSLGQLVWKEDDFDANSPTNIQLLETGIYLVKIETTDGIFVTKVLVE